MRSIVKSFTYSSRTCVRYCIELLSSGHSEKRSDVVHHGSFLVYNIVHSNLLSSEAIRPGPWDFYALSVKRAKRRYMLTSYREYLLNLLKVAEVAF